MKKLSTSEIEVRVWATIIIGLFFVLAISTLSIIYSITFVEQPPVMSPIDEVYTGILKDIMLLCIGAISGLASGKVLNRNDR
jgi:hypothetical protein